MEKGGGRTEEEAGDKDYISPIFRMREGTRAKERAAPTIVGTRIGVELSLAETRRFACC